MNLKIIRLPTKRLNFYVFSLFLFFNSLLNPFSGLAIDNYQNQDSGHKHPITHEKQYYIVPSDCQNGDNVGKVYELWTDRRFNDRGRDSYSFEIVSGNTNSSFSIERNSGELLVRNAGGIKGDVTLVVKVSIGDDSQLSTVHIKRVNSSDVVYIDSGFSGSANGSRSAPYNSFKGSGHKNGKPGKYYLYRRGRTYGNDILLIYNGEASAPITIGAWGSGARPVLDGQNNNNTAIQLGSVQSSGTGLDKTAFNVDVMDLEFKRYQSRTIVLTRRGKNFNFRRLKLGDTKAMNGLIWLSHQLNLGELYPSNIYGSDIELYGFTDRGFKIERGGEVSNPIVFENIKAYNGSKETYVSATDNPYVTIRYLDVDHGNKGATGPNIRYGQHNLEWVYIKGALLGIYVWKRDNTHSGVRGAHIRDVIIDGTTKGDGILFETKAASSYAPENIEISRVEIRNAGRHGINIQQGAKNVTLSYSLIHGSGQNGVKVDGTTSGIKTHNSIITDNHSRDISAGGNTDVKNTIYENKSGEFKEEKNTSETGYFENRQKKDYRPKTGAPYLNKGSALGYKFDLEGNKIPSKPTIGAFELEADEVGEEILRISVGMNPAEGGKINGLPGNRVEPGDKVKLIAEAKDGYKFESWSRNDKIVSKQVSYEFEMPENNLFLTANFKASEDPVQSSSEVSDLSLKKGLVAFYEMNSNVSNKLEDSHGTNDGVNYRISHVKGFSEQGNQYDGRSSISAVPHSNNLNLQHEFTLMADVFRNGNGQSGTSIIVGKTNVNRYNQDYSLGITPQNKIRIRANLPDLTEWISDVTVPSGKWVRIIATYKSGKGFQLFMDENESEKSSKFSGRITNSNKPLYIGSNSDEENGEAANDRRFEGKLDNVGIWNRKLLPEEIDQLMTEKISYADFGEQGSESFRTIQSEISEKNLVSKNDLEQGLIDRQSVQLEYLIGPNPTTDQINVMFTNLDGDYEFEIRTISMNGQVLEEYHATPQDAKITLDVADLNPGVYILQLNYKGKMISNRKFIKQ